MEKLGHKIWKGSKVMAIDATRMEGGMYVLWHLDLVYLTRWRVNNFSLMANFKVLGLSAK